MLSNAYFLAKFRFDTAENEPAKNFQKISKKMHFFATQVYRGDRTLDDFKSVDVGFGVTKDEVMQGNVADGRRRFLANFGKMLLVFGWIGSDFCNKICV